MPEEINTGQIVLLVTTILGFLVQIYRENRNRRWDLEDRKLARQKLEVSTQELSNKIDDNTRLSERAFHEANNFNQKLVRLANQFNNSRIREHIPNLPDKLEEIEETGKDTNKRVREIQKDAAN